MAYAKRRGTKKSTKLSKNGYQIAPWQCRAADTPRGSLKSLRLAPLLCAAACGECGKNRRLTPLECVIGLQTPTFRAQFIQLVACLLSTTEVIAVVGVVAPVVGTRCARTQAVAALLGLRSVGGEYMRGGELLQVRVGQHGQRAAQSAGSGAQGHVRAKVRVRERGRAAHTVNTGAQKRRRAVHAAPRRGGRARRALGSGFGRSRFGRFR
jgi:hypothetical protein